MSLSLSAPKQWNLSLQPPLAWTAILGFVLITVVGTLIAPGRIMNLVFPASAFAVAALLYFRYPLLYNGFSWWIWFATAFVRRLIDFRGGFTDPSPVLLAPLLVTGLTLLTMGRYLPTALRSGGLPFVMTMGAVVYGFLVKVIDKPSPTALISLLDWLVPITYGFHLFVQWRDYPNYRQNLQRTFVWGVLVMGAYGIIQFMLAPAWDLAWLTNSNMVTANGFHGKTLGPFAIRVFSTMHSVEPFGAVLTGGLLLMFTSKEVVNLPASIVGYLTFLFTMMRSAWIGWAAGLLTLIGSLTTKAKLRLVLTITVILLCVLPLATMEPFSEAIGGRLQTLVDFQTDDSAQGRQEDFKYYIASAVTNVTGSGIERQSWDNTILALLNYIGWVGTVPYLGGMLLIVMQLFLSPAGRIDPFIAVSRAIVVSCLVRLPANGIVFGPSCVLLWGFLGIGLAAIKYHHHQAQLNSTQLSLNNLSYPTPLPPYVSEHLSPPN